MNVEIAEFTDAHAEAAKDLLVELQTHLSELDGRGVIVLKHNFRDDYFRFVSAETEKQHGKIFIASVRDRAVGIVVCKIFQGGGEEEITTSCPKVGFVSDLSVTAGERGKGIGKLLLTRAERYFQESGCEYTQLEVFAPNTGAAEFYQRAGYEPCCIYLSKSLRDKPKI